MNKVDFIKSYFFNIHFTCGGKCSLNIIDWNSEINIKTFADGHRPPDQIVPGML